MAKEALKTGSSIYDLVLTKELMTKEQLEKVLRPENMITPTRSIITGTAT